MSAKRQREEKITFDVYQPCRLQDWDSGEYTREQLYNRQVLCIYNMKPSLPFWRLLFQYCTSRESLLCKKGESTPFTDYEAPLSSLEGCVFVRCEWAPEYESLRPQYDVYKYTHLLHCSTKQVKRHRKSVEICNDQLAFYSGLLKNFEEHQQHYEAQLAVALEKVDNKT